MISSYMHVYMSWATNKNYFQYQWIIRLLFTLIDLSLLHIIRENSAIYHFIGITILKRKFIIHFVF